LTIFGDGDQSRDFTYIDNVIYANYLAMISENEKVLGNYYNVGCGARISLNEIVKYLEKKISQKIEIIYEEARKGDVRSSLASLEKINNDLNYETVVEFFCGLDCMIDELNAG
jgi:UDP-N-acetylglucosamine/UDP-N-acetylgalactosamine 4-epimerase